MGSSKSLLQTRGRSSTSSTNGGLDFGAAEQERPPATAETRLRIGVDDPAPFERRAVRRDPAFVTNDVPVVTGLLDGGIADHVAADLRALVAFQETDDRSGTRAFERRQLGQLRDVLDRTVREI